MRREHKRTFKGGKGPIPLLLKKKASSMVMLGLLTLGSAIGVIYSKHFSRSLHIQLEQLQKSRDQLHVEWTQLLLEEGTLASDVRVEKVAREKLGMVIPSQSEMVVIQP